MLLTVVPAIFLAILAGLGVKLILTKRGGQEQITNSEFLIGVLVIILVIAPLVGYFGWELARANQVTYNEYWNGWETAAERTDYRCTEDGPCNWTYDCHPYLVYVHRSCTNSNGKGTHECGGYETRYHQCPYVNIESTYNVDTTLGSYTISAHRFPDNPQAHRWDNGERIPEGVISRAGTGIPKFWDEVWQRVSAGTPGPATTRKEYKNYILASDKTILKQHSSDIGRYQKQGLLPPVVSSVSGYYDADKVHFVGYRTQNTAVWQHLLQRLNAALGKERQGDVQIVVVESDVVSIDPDTYALALKASWQDMKIFGKDAFSKNGIGIIIGTKDGNTVAWARAFTGMPLGNEQMVVALQSALKGQPLDPVVILGQIDTTSVVSKSSNRVSLSISKTSHSGIIAPILWGDNDKSLRFTRLGMTGKGSGQGSGFLYLYSEISPTDEQRWWIAITTFLLACMFWVAAAVFDMSFTGRSRY